MKAKRTYQANKGFLEGWLASYYYNGDDKAALALYAEVELERLRGLYKGNGGTVISTRASRKKGREELLLLEETHKNAKRREVLL